MMKRLSILSALCVLILVACQPSVTEPAQPAPPAVSAPAAQEPAANATDVASAESAPSTEARIANAVSAAPTVIGKDATILDWPTEDGGPMVVLREGANGWICITDWPASPGNDPMCIDSMFAEWNDALGAGAPLTVDRPGVATRWAARGRARRRR